MDSLGKVAGQLKAAAVLRQCTINRLQALTGVRHRRWLCRSIAASLIFLLSATLVHAASVPSGFRVETLLSGLQQPVAFAAAPSNKFYIAEKRGVIKVLDKGTLLSRPFIDISAVVNDIQDRGLLSVALHPDFPSTPYVYVAYTYDPPAWRNRSGSLAPDGDGKRTGRLDRITADKNQNYNVAISNSRVTLLGTNSTVEHMGNAANPNDYVYVSCQHDNGTPVRDCLPADSLTHTLSFIAFDRSGKLIASNGDGASYRGAEASTLRTQNLHSLAGKIIRIDPISGDGVSDNPYYNGNPADNISKVVSLGLRNPFRFTLHPQSGELFIGDVGWGTWEEVNQGNGNFGWPCYEGGNGNNARQPTYATLDGCKQHYNSGGSIVAPAYAYHHNGGGGAIQLGDFLASSRYPQAYRNALLFNDFTLGQARIAYFDGGQNLQRVDSFGSGFSGTTQLTMAPDGWLYSTNVYTGKFERLTHVNGDTTPVVNNPAPAPAPVNNNTGNYSVIIQQPQEGSYEVDQTIPFAGYATNNRGETVSAEQLRWTVAIHHNEHIHTDHHVHSGDAGSFYFPDHGDNSKAEICLSLASASHTRTCTSIYPRTGILRIDSEPSGLRFLFSTAADLSDPKHRTAVREVTTPAEFEVNIGGTRELRAIDAEGFQLTGWSTGDTDNPVYWNMPYGNATITAYFADQRQCGSACPQPVPPSPPVSVALTTPADTTQTDPVCIDVDGDGWGWDGEKGCRPNAEASQCVDYDGDGYGWDGEKTCIAP